MANLTTDGGIEEDRLVGLTPSQMKALVALLAGSTQAQAAATAGVGRQQVAYWIHHDIPFRVSLKKEKLALLRGARTVRAAGALEAANCLRALLNDPKADTNQKLKAASMLLASSGIDQAPAPWPVLNDVEMIVSAELADAAAHVDHAAREMERLELEMARRRRYDPEESARLDAAVMETSAQADAVDRQLRKFASHRRLTAKQSARKLQLENQLAELGLQFAAAEIRLLQHQSVTKELKDLGPKVGGQCGSSDRDAVFLRSLRREQADDG